MLDIKIIRQNPDFFNQEMKKRSCNISAENLIALDEEKRSNINILQQLQSQRNSIAKKIAQSKNDGNESPEIFEESKKINKKIAEIELNIKENNKLDQILLNIPNIAQSDVPFGKDENDNQEISKFGSPREFDFTAQPHDAIGENLNMLDFKQSANMSGARFSTLIGDLALLERALSNFMLDIAQQNDYQEISPPNLVKSDAMKYSGQLPKFSEEAFQTSNGYWLIPTSEVSLVNLACNKTFKEQELPLRFSACTPCFRSEAGSAGKDTKGMIRQHQFKKVELVSITTANNSKQEHERMTNIACQILEKLELPYKKVLLCSNDMGFCAQKTYDIEVWMPSQNKYREISSCSNCGDFQSRRGNIKYKDINNKNQFAHTLNGSALAVGRTIIAILENYQNKDGSVTVPTILQNYLNGMKIIKKSS
ncbi:serine--tRNA ligase [Rickettsiales bacterium]|nr:serine--tRNA ligase [Rickettsiales bacterium]